MVTRMDSKFEPLATYNAERSRGIVHTAEYDARMAELQREFDAASVPSSETFYLLACLDCDQQEYPLAMPFSTPAERGKWAAEHTRETGHDHWFVKDMQRTSAMLAVTGSDDGQTSTTR